MTNRYPPTQTEITRLVREEENKSAKELINRLRTIRVDERVLLLVNLITQAKKSTDLIPIIKKAVTRGNFLIELQEAEERIRTAELRQRRPEHPDQHRRGSVAKPAESQMTQEEMRRRLSKRFKVKNPGDLNGDAKFITGTLLPFFKVKAVRLKHSTSRREWPDIWVQLKQVPVITVTNEWMRQPTDERRKRLVHEFLHLSGMSHGKVNGLVYSTYPDKDTYSKHLYSEIIKRC